MLIRRVAAALVGIPIVYLVIYFGGVVFYLGMALVAALAWVEYAKLLRQQNIHVATWTGLIGILSIMAATQFGNMTEVMFLFTAFIIILLSWVVFDQQHFGVDHAALTLLGCLYIGGLLSTLLLLRDGSPGVNYYTPFGSVSAGVVYTWTVFLGTWASDTFAYFIGCYFGKHKLCPQISPGKTIEGFVGGLLGSTVITCIVVSIMHIGWVAAIVLGVLIGLAASLGDLVESCIKRFSGAKDSGKIIPGHGGVLDRFDSVLFVSPVVYYFLYWTIMH